MSAVMRIRENVEVKHYIMFSSSFVYLPSNYFLIVSIAFLYLYTTKARIIIL